MQNKEELVNNIKEWLKIDNDVVKLKKEIRTRNEEKKKITDLLMKIMKTNEIDCFDINGGALVYKKNVIKKPINAKMLLNNLKNYYKDSPDMAEILSKYILENREEQVKETIKRKVNKQVVEG
jgi:hypothetical protein